MKKIGVFFGQIFGISFVGMFIILLDATLLAFMYYFIGILDKFDMKKMEEVLFWIFYLLVIFSGGLIVLFMEFIAGKYILKHIGCIKKNVFLICVSVVFSLLILLVFPFCSEHLLIFYIIMSIAQFDNGLFYLAFFQLSSCIGAGICVFVCLLNMLKYAIKQAVFKTKKDNLEIRSSH